MKPSVGRVVHYVSYGSADGRYKSECRAAIITEVRLVDYEEIGIAVLNPTGLFFDRQVRHSEDDHTGGTWHWPERVDDDDAIALPGPPEGDH